MNGTAPPEITREDYARAERYLFWNAAKLAFKCHVEPNWLDEREAFWYLEDGRDGKRFMLVDLEEQTKAPAFDHARLAAALSEAGGTHCVETQLPFDELDFTEDGAAVEFWVDDTTWTCCLETYECERIDDPLQPAEDELVSPDGKWAAFVRDYDLYVRSTETDEEYRLTSDGERWYDYATYPEGSTTEVTDRLNDTPLEPAAVWSEDSAKLLTHRLDQREVEQTHLLQAVPPEGYRPVLHSYKYALVGDEHVPLSQLIIIDIEERSTIEVEGPQLFSISSTPFEQDMAWWSGDGTRAYFIHTARDRSAQTLYEVDADTGECREVLREEGPTYVEVSPDRFPPNVEVLEETSEVLWWSERDGWGHLYLYDAESGELKNQVTSGAWQVRELSYVDEENRLAYFTAGGREEDTEPYCRRLYRAPLDGGEVDLLSPEEADHNVEASPCGRFFVDTFSTVETPPVSVVRSTTGEQVLKLQEADLEPLLDTGFRWPEPFRVKARDGVTDIHGTLFFPSNFDPEKKYPVVDSIYPGPQVIRSPKAFPHEDDRAWRTFWDCQALAELGFIVATIDGMGTPYRSKAFHDVASGSDFGEAGGLEDHVAGLRQLADQRPYMDLSGVGIYGHSGGGYASARAMFLYPNFYSVAVSSAGNHDQRGYLSGWGEGYIGLIDDVDYDPQANPPLAERLEGKLLLVYGDMDDNVHPCLVLQLADALIKANRDFDLLALPNRNHRIGYDAYFLRRKWDYFVRHLMGAEPPEYRIEECPEEYVPDEALRQTRSE